ncbi:MAG: DNA internalization-related competence protein ComEC/Rec2 [Anaerofustis sp.]
MKRPALIFLLIVILTTISVVNHFAWIAVPILFLFLLFLWIKKQMAGIAIISLLFLCVTLLHSLFIVSHTTQLDRFDKTDVTITAKALSYPEYTDGRTRAVFEVLSVSELPEYQNKDRILISVYTENVFQISPGGIYQITGRTKVPEHETNPGGFDYNLYLKTQNLYLTMWATPQDVSFVGQDHLFARYDILLALRENCVQTLYRSLPETQASVISSVIFGSDEIDADVLEDFRDIGIAHVLAVSGMNTALIYALVYFILKRFRAKPMTVFAVTAAGLLFYNLLTGLSVSLIRASIMLCFVCYAKAAKKNGDTFNFLCLAALLILLFNPLAVFSVSFQMSFAAVLAIVLFVPIAEKKIRIQHRMIKKITVFAVMCIIVQIVMAPITAYYFNSFSLVSILANLVIAPVVGVIFVLAVCGLALSFFPAAATLIFGAVNILLEYTIRASALLSSLPYANLYVRATPWYGFLLIYVLVFAVFGYLDRKTVAGKRIMAATLSLFVTFYALSFLPPFYSKLYFIDVGFGDCILIESNRGDTVLIDGGGYLSSNTADYDILPLLDAYHIRKIDAVIATHSDADHIQGLIDLIGQVPIKSLYVNDDGGALYDTIIKKATASNIPINTANRGDCLSIGEISFDVLNPSPQDLDVLSQNDTSIILLLHLDGYSALLTGDAGKTAIKSILPELQEPIDIIKTPHHGSYYSNLDDLYRACEPGCCVVSVGTNGYHLPSSKTISLLEEMNIPYYRTDDGGCITFTMMPNRIRISTYLSE